MRESARSDSLAQGTVSLEELNIAPQAGLVKDILADSFQQCFAVTLLRSGLEPAEHQAASYLLENKYSREMWNRYGNDS